MWNTVRIIPDSNGYRLPTAAQCEFAARGGIHRRGAQQGEEYDFVFAGSDNGNDVGFFLNNHLPNALQLVGRRAPNELGLFDMSGNIRIWTWSRGGWTLPADVDEIIGLTDPEHLTLTPGFERVARNGGFGHGNAFAAVSHAGGSLPPTGGGGMLGLRLVRPVTDDD
jgi:formylglycine-generating enzyme required for sulfatase activity